MRLAFDGGSASRGNSCFFPLHFYSRLWVLPRIVEIPFAHKCFARCGPLFALLGLEMKLLMVVYEREKAEQGLDQETRSQSITCSLVTLRHILTLQFLHLLVERVIHDTLLSASQEHLCKAPGDARRSQKDSCFPLGGKITPQLTV